MSKAIPIETLKNVIQKQIKILSSSNHIVVNTEREHHQSGKSHKRTVRRWFQEYAASDCSSCGSRLKMKNRQRFNFCLNPIDTIYIIQKRKLQQECHPISYSLLSLSIDTLPPPSFHFLSFPIHSNPSHQYNHRRHSPNHRNPGAVISFNRIRRSGCLLDR